jgi:hypothetical protein
LKILKDRYQQIALIKEEIWRQRVKRQWIAEGDKNTNFFHLVANVQKQQNTIHTIQENDEMHTSRKEKTRILFQYFCKLMGTEISSSIDFDFNRVYDTQQAITEIDEMITEQEIRGAINT